MFFDWFGRIALKMKLHVIIAVLSFFLSHGIANAQPVKEAQQIATTLKKNPSKEDFKNFVDKQLKPIMPALENGLKTEKSEKTAVKMIDSLNELGKASDVKVKTVVDRSIRGDGLIKLRSILKNWSGRDLAINILDRSIIIDKDTVGGIVDSTKDFGMQSYKLFKIIEERLDKDYNIVFNK